MGLAFFILLLTVKYVVMEVNLGFQLAKSFKTAKVNYFNIPIIMKDAPA